MTDIVERACILVNGLRAVEAEQPYALDRPHFGSIDDVLYWLRETAWSQDGDQARRTVGKRLAFQRYRWRHKFAARGGR